MSPRAWRAAAITAAVVVLVAGCSQPDLSPVPMVADPDGQYLCDGVPREGAELLMGGRATDPDPLGEWDGPDSLFFECEIDGPGDTWLSIVRRDVVVEDFLRSEDGNGATPIDLDFPGAGYALYGRVSWGCGTYGLTINSNANVTGRDLKDDLTRYLASMLPWACGDTPAPASTT